MYAFHTRIQIAHFILLCIVFSLDECTKGWVHANNSLRKEIHELIQAMTCQKGVVQEDWQVTCIQSVWGAHWENMHSHHTKEDTIMVPFMKTRLHCPVRVRSR
jgi:hypothetical protein